MVTVHIYIFVTANILYNKYNNKYNNILCVGIRAIIQLSWYASGGAGHSMNSGRVLQVLKCCLYIFFMFLDSFGASVSKMHTVVNLFVNSTVY